MMYGPILERWKDDESMDPTCLLLRLLASVIHHFDWIRSIARTRTNHEFNLIPLMFRPDIVERLKILVTTEPSIVIAEASGIPPHVEHSIKIQLLLTVCNECLTSLKNR